MSAEAIYKRCTMINKTAFSNAAVKVYVVYLLYVPAPLLVV